MSSSLNRPGEIGIISLKTMASNINGANCLKLWYWEIIKDATEQGTNRLNLELHNSINLSVTTENYSNCKSNSTAKSSKFCKLCLISSNHNLSVPPGYYQHISNTHSFLLRRIQTVARLISDTLRPSWSMEFLKNEQSVSNRTALEY